MLTIKGAIWRAVVRLAQENRYSSTVAVGIEHRHIRETGRVRLPDKLPFPLPCVERASVHKEGERPGTALELDDQRLRRLFQRTVPCEPEIQLCSVRG